jgi:alkylated DNA repair dioxygenase AlkB
MSRNADDLFDVAVPEGFRYSPDFLDAAEESALVSSIERIEFSAYELRGVVARRRVALFGESYDRSMKARPLLPDFLMALRQKVAAWANVGPTAFSMALINEYPPGAPIGWHRDAPQHGIVAGVSLLSEARMKFRPYVSQPAAASQQRPRRIAAYEIALAPRSAYLMTGESRNAYEHHIPAVDALRYSVTFRTRRRGNDPPPTTAGGGRG